MALSPGIPTSFVPKQAAPQQPQRRMSSGTNVFLAVSLIVAGVSIVLAGLVFAYDRYLNYLKDAKATELSQAQASVDQNTVEGFVRLRDRFTIGKQILDKHVVLSNLFDALESDTLQNVRYNSLAVNVNDDRTATLTINGVARNFNTLAAQSNAIAADARFRSAIFSGIQLNTDNTVAFHLTAQVDPKLVIIGAAAAGAPVAPPAVPVAGTSTPPLTQTALPPIKNATSTGSGATSTKP